MEAKWLHVEGVGQVLILSIYLRVFISTYYYASLIGCAWWACKMMRFSATAYCNGDAAYGRNKNKEMEVIKIKVKLATEILILKYLNVLVNENKQQ